MASNLYATSLDARDAKAAATFWAAALGRTVADGATEAEAAIAPDAAVSGPLIAFHQVPEGKTVKNRVHFDLLTPAAGFDAEVSRLTELGAAKLSEVNGGRHYATLADPEGNEFDLIAG
jgi:predicted enzyme related to lactoylglutathione lyase